MICELRALKSEMQSCGAPATRPSSSLASWSSGASFSRAEADGDAAMAAAVCHKAAADARAAGWTSEIPDTRVFCFR